LAQEIQVIRALRDKPVVLAVLGAACISSSGIVVKLAGTSAGTTAFYRCVIALPGLLFLAALERRRLGDRDRRSRVLALFAGASLGVDLVLWTHAIYAVGAGIATVLGNLQVLFVAFIAWLVFKEHPRARFLVSLPVVVAGVVLVAGIASRGSGTSNPVAGIVYGLGTSITYAVYIIVLRHSTSTSRHIAGPLADATIGAAVAALIVGWPAGEMSFLPGWRVIGWLTVLALVSQTTGWLLITSALPRLPASISSLLLLLQPAAALVLADIVLSQHPTMLQVLGAVLVCGGVLYAARSSGVRSIEEAEPVPG
jgi:drug/metabolite transporter (DMT)-like permease